MRGLCRVSGGTVVISHEERPEKEALGLYRQFFQLCEEQDFLVEGPLWQERSAQNDYRVFIHRLRLKEPPQP